MKGLSESMPVKLDATYVLISAATALFSVASLAGAQAPDTPQAAPTAVTNPPAATDSKAAAIASDAPAATPAPRTWHIGPMELSGFIDGYYSYNGNQPAKSANDQMNDFYNFNDKTDQINLSSAFLTLNHDPAPVGAHIEFVYGRTNKLFNFGSTEMNYVEQAFISVKPPKAKGFELDLGKFVTFAGAETANAKDNWNYSRSLLFSYAIPYWNFGGRASMPVSKTETVGVQLVNGWNSVTKANGGPTVGLNSTYTTPKYTWSADYYGGPEKPAATQVFRNLIDTTLLLTPSAKLNAYINFDYGRDHADSSAVLSDGIAVKHWDGIAAAVHEQFTGTSAVAGRFEYFSDPQGNQTGSIVQLKEVTATYEFKWKMGWLTRAEYRGDFADNPVFHSGSDKLVTSQSTFSIGLIAPFGPKR